MNTVKTPIYVHAICGMGITQGYNEHTCTHPLSPNRLAYPPGTWFSLTCNCGIVRILDNVCTIHATYIYAVFYSNICAMQILVGVVG